MAPSASVVINHSTRQQLQPDTVIVSYLKRIAAADPRDIRRKQDEDPTQYRLLSQFDPEIIEIILKYARGDQDTCQRSRCRLTVHMTDAFRHYKACAVCRARRALQDIRVADAVVHTAPATSGPKAKKVRIRFSLGCRID